MQRFHKDISIMVCARNVYQSEEAILDLVANSVAVNLHVFRPLVENWVGSNVHCRLVVTEKLSIRRDLHLQAGEKLLKPEQLTRRMRHTPFSYGATAADNVMFLGFPGDQRRSKVNTIPVTERRVSGQVAQLVSAKALRQMLEEAE